MTGPESDAHYHVMCRAGVYTPPVLTALNQAEGRVFEAKRDAEGDIYVDLRQYHTFMMTQRSTYFTANSIDASTVSGPPFLSPLLTVWNTSKYPMYLVFAGSDQCVVSAAEACEGSRPVEGVSQSIAARAGESLVLEFNLPKGTWEVVEHTW